MTDFIRLTILTLCVGLSSIFPFFAFAADKQIQRSDAAYEFLNLYNEFKSFRDREDFLLNGYGACCKYKVWADSVLELGDNSGSELLKEIGITPSILHQLGKETFRNRVDRREFKNSLERDLILTLTQWDNELLTGVVISNERACRDVQVFAKAVEKELNGHLLEAFDIIIDSDECFLIPNMVRVSETLATAEIGIKNKLMYSYSKIILPNGDAVWLKSDFINY